MDINQLSQSAGLLTSPLTFAVLVGIAFFLAWLAFAPVRREQDDSERMDDYLAREDIVEQEELGISFGGRVAVPLLRRVLRIVGRLAPRRNVESTNEMLQQAGEPGGLTALDFYGMRLLAAVLLGGGYVLLLGSQVPVSEAVRNALLLGLAGYFVPLLLMRRRVRRRKWEITRALPDALDMLTVGVEAGLGFESAMLKVGERWDNALTQEFRRAVAEMRVGTPREEALRRMAGRTDVVDLNTFVAVLVQSSILGVSIAQVLQSQAAQMRVRRRQRAEELARQAGVKMIFPLGILIFPAMLVVILGPAIPALIGFFGAMDLATMPAP